MIILDNPYMGTPQEPITWLPGFHVNRIVDYRLHEEGACCTHLVSILADIVARVKRGEKVHRATYCAVSVVQ